MPRQDPSPGLFVDLYELTMAQAYWQSSKTAAATFSLYFRNYPPDRAYFVFAGLSDVVDHLEALRFSDGDIAFLQSSNRFDNGFLDYLRGFRFTGSVRAMPEGTICFANEPVIEVTAPVIEAQMIETSTVNQVHFSTVVATKAARIACVARGRTLIDFAARRTHGTDAASKLARATYMTGFAGTSNVQAGALYGIPTHGTMAHSFVTTFQDEAESFRAYSESFPDTSTFLVDTYDTIAGTAKAIQVAQEMRRRGHELRAIRLDSGDLLGLSAEARKLLDQAGFHNVQVFASGGLDEFEVDSLLTSGAPIDGFGVGTKVGVSADAPWADCVYKLVEYDGQPVLKLSPDRQTFPGAKQVYRFRDTHGSYQRDVVACANEPSPPGSEPLLAEVMRDGRCIASLPSLGQTRERFSQEFNHLPSRHKALRSPSAYEVTNSPALDRLRLRVSLEHGAGR